MKKILIILGLIIIVVVAYYKIAYSSINTNFRMIVEVDTPTGVKSGSSVFELKTQRWPEWLAGLSAGNISDSSIEGEAVFVDLGDNKNLVLILNTGTSYRRSLTSFPPFIFYLAGYYPGIGYGLDMIKKLSESRMIGEKAEVPKDWMPTMVTFNDINKPGSIELIFATNGKDSYRDREVVADNFVVKFGEGYQLKRMTLEVTNDPITRNIVEHLPWIKNPDLGATPLEGINLYDNYHFRSTHSTS